MRFLLWVLHLLAVWLGLLPAPSIAAAPSRFTIERREIGPGVYGFCETEIHSVVSGHFVAVVGRDAVLLFDAGHQLAVTRQIVAQVEQMWQELAGTLQPEGIS